MNDTEQRWAGLAATATRVGRAAANVALRPPLLGAAYLLGLAAYAGRGDLVDPNERVLGPDTGRVAQLMLDVYGAEVDRVRIAIAAVAVALGALLGLAAWALVAARRLALDRPPPSTFGLALRTAPLVVLLHAWALAVSVATDPQLYEKAFYRTRGWSRDVMVFLTDRMGPRLVVAAGVAGFALHALGLPQLLFGFPSRAALLATRVARACRWRLSTIAAGAAITAAVVLLGDPTVLGGLHGHRRSGRPNVLVLASDGLRNDRLDPRVTPVLSALADRGVRFDHAYTSLPRTFASWMTLLTGRFPHHHGIRSMFARWEERSRDFDTLPEHLARGGYRTAVVSDYAGDMFRLADFGFQQRTTPLLSARQTIRRSAFKREIPLLPFLHSRTGRAMFPALRGLHDASDPEMIADEAIAQICRGGDSPLFLTVFFSTTHFPYAAPWPAYRRFTDPDYSGAFKYQKAVTFARAEMSPRDVAQVRGLYDGAAASVDRAAGRVLEALRRCGLEESTIVVVTADHGEQLFETGHDQGHGDTLVGDEVLHVPLAIVDPRVTAPRRVDGIVRDVDLAPTLYELLGEPPPNDLDGRSLASAMRGQPLAPALAYSETELWLTDSVDVPPAQRIPYPTISNLLEIDLEHHDQLVVRRALGPTTLIARHRMVRDERFKLLYAPGRDRVAYVLFDTTEDPGETRDVGAEHPAELARLKAELWAWMLRDPSMTEWGGRLFVRDDVAGWPAPSEEGR